MPPAVFRKIILMDHKILRTICQDMYGSHGEEFIFRYWDSLKQLWLNYRLHLPYAIQKAL